MSTKRDEALHERDSAVRQRDEALHERDSAVRQRDEALHERDDAVRQRDETKTSIIDSYVKGTPSYPLAFGLFEGEWTSDVPGYGGGISGLFDDHRIKWFAAQCGGFQAKRVLELGPLEGGHTSMMANSGADITSVESNTRAFLKCLIVQNALKFKADFILGDFPQYLENCDQRFDVLIASGVLYHMSNPVHVLVNAAKVADNIGLWTHYYDSDIIKGRDQLRRKFESTPRVEMLGHRRIELYHQFYLDALQWKGFCGGSATDSWWLTQGGILAILEELGFDVTIGEDHKTHPNGPAMTLFASRRKS